MFYLFGWKRNNERREETVAENIVNAVVSPIFYTLIGGSGRKSAVNKGVEVICPNTIKKLF
ncbi:MAG: hypothetical protein SVO01_04120 [Thermotogota bacterium]|nr:hypothetical protein [Thermotogota bacterium]